MKKHVYAVTALAVVVSGAVEWERRSCGLGLECLAEAPAPENLEEFETVFTMQGLPEPLTDIQLLSAPLTMEAPTANPRAQLLLPVPSVMQEGILKGLQGDWYSAADAQDVFNVEGTTRQSAYAGAGAGEERIGVSWRCGSYSGGGSYLRTLSEAGEEMCYSIDSLSEGDLMLTYMPTGESLHYLRKQ